MTSTRTDLWIGTYPVAGAGTPAGIGEGIWQVALDTATGALTDARLVTTLPSPSFLAVHPSGGVLYAVGESTDGTVTACVVSRGATTDGSRTVLGPQVTVSSGGADPCHLLLDEGAHALYVANYSSGTVGVISLEADGSFSPEVVASGSPTQVFSAADSASAGTGPDRERQDGPHAHFVALAPGGRYLLAVDLGTDEVRRFQVRADGLLAADGIAATLPPGTGPRHLVVGPGDHLYVVGELSSTVHVLAWDRGTATGRVVQSLPACVSGPRAEGRGARNLPSHVLRDGDLLHVAVRGADVVSTFRLSADGSRLEASGETAAAGTWPRHLEAVAGLLVVADQVSSELVVLAPGSSEPVRGVLPLPSPACVVIATEA